MSFFDRVLEPPTYGYERNGTLYVPTHKELVREFFKSINVFRSKKNWLQFVGWFTTSLFAIPFFIFIFKYFRWDYAFLGLTYSMVCLGSFGTFWFHRYSTHRGYRFRNPFAIFLLRNLVIKIIPEEVYVISHHVHHRKSELPGDPYNVHAGWLYCFLADANHQRIGQNLNPSEYAQLKKLLRDTGVKLNSYEQYQKWGSLCHPFYTICHYVFNWLFWYGVFYFIGGTQLAVAIFGMTVVWAVGVRTFNFDGHGGGKDLRRKGIDFNWEDLSINRVWPGYVAGEWHNNHHLYPGGARSGFLPYQIDIPWYLVKFLHHIGAITDYKDDRAAFYRDHYEPYLKSLKTPPQSEEMVRNTEDLISATTRTIAPELPGSTV